MPVPAAAAHLGYAMGDEGAAAPSAPELDEVASAQVVGVDAAARVGETHFDGHEAAGTLVAHDQEVAAVVDAIDDAAHGVSVVGAGAIVTIVIAVAVGITDRVDEDGAAVEHAAEADGDADAEVAPVAQVAFRQEEPVVAATELDAVAGALALERRDASFQRHAIVVVISAIDALV